MKTHNDGFRPKFRLSETAKTALQAVEKGAAELHINRGCSFSGGSYPLWGRDGEHAALTRCKIAAYAGELRERLRGVSRTQPYGDLKEWVVVDRSGGIVHETDSHRSAAIRANKIGARIESRGEAAARRQKEIAAEAAKIAEMEDRIARLIAAIADEDSVTEIPVWQLSDRTRLHCGV